MATSAEPHLGLNLVFLVPGETGGMETYARELIAALVKERPGLRVTTFVSREAAEDRDAPWSSVPSVVVPVHARRRSERVRGEQQLLPPLARLHGVDVLHSLASTAPAWGAFARVVTIHDVIYRMYPEAHAGLRSLGMRVLVPLAARRSTRVIVPSRRTRDDLLQLLRVPAAKIDVIPEGVGTSARPEPVDEAELRSRYGLERRKVILSVSAKRPHKNLTRLIDALAEIPREERPVLVLPGYPTWHEQELRRRAADLALEHEALFLGWIPGRELEGWYRLASSFVFPSLYEGFGLPVLEAMARGVPVLCSNRGSLPELAGAAAVYFDPEKPSAIAAAIRRVLGDPNERDRLRRLGLEQAARFDWRETARATLASYERALESQSKT